MAVYGISAAADDGLVAYRGSNIASSLIAPVTSFICYGDGSIYFRWTENPSQASILAEIKNVSSVVVWTYTADVSSGTNNAAPGKVLEGRTDGPFTFSLKIYDGAGQTGTLLETGEAEPFDITGLDYIESTPTLVSNIFIGVGEFVGFADQDALYDSLCWMRFQNLVIPQGSTVVKADLKLQAISSGDNVIDFTLSAEDTDDATTNPSSRSDYLARTRTTAQLLVDLHPSTGPWDPGVVYDFDISTVLQEIVDRPGWVSGNDVLIFWEHTGFSGQYLALNNDYNEAADFPSASGPRLDVEYGLEGVGTAAGTSTATAETQYGVVGTAVGQAEAQAFSGFGQTVVGTAAGTSDALGIAEAHFLAVGTAAGVGDADGAVGLQGSDAVGTAAGTSTATAEGVSGVAGTAAGTSTVTGISSNTGEAVGTSVGTSDALGIAEAEAATVGTSAGIGDALGIAEATTAAIGTAAGVGDADGAVGLQGFDAVGTAAGTSDALGFGAGTSLSVGTAAGTSDALAVREVLVEAVGSAVGAASMDAFGGTGISIVGTAAGTSLMEGRKKSDQQVFLDDLSERLGRRSVGGDSTRFLELDGAKIIEPTAFEPDAATHHESHYYNAVTNTLYRKVTTRSEPGVVVAHWQKTSD